MIEIVYKEASQLIESKFGEAFFIRNIYEFSLPLKTYQQPVENLLINLETNIETLFGYFKSMTNRISF